MPGRFGHFEASAMAWLFVILLGIGIFLGYTFGKDLALRDNAREAQAAQGAR